MNLPVKRKNSLVPSASRMFGWSPFTSMLDEIMGEAFLGSPFVSANTAPSMNLVEREGGYDVQLAVPGMREEDLNISLQNSLLTVSGKKSETHEDEKVRHREFGSYEFSRSVSLPQNIQPDGIKAALSNGILTVSIPTSDEKPSLDIPIDVIE